MRLLVISPHPDDETLGAGGTLLKSRKKGGDIFWLNLTDMKKSYGYTGIEIQNRARELKKINCLYGFDGFYNLGLKPGGLDVYPLRVLVDKISEILKKVKADTIFLPFIGDIHSDHRIAFEAGFATTKVFNSAFVKKVLMMEIASETDFSLPFNSFVPNYFEDISDYMEQKLQLLGIYRSEVKPPPFPRSIEKVRFLASNRGSQAGCSYAEAFMLLKSIN